MQVSRKALVKMFTSLLLLSALSCALADVSLDFRVTPSVVDPSRTKEVTLTCTANVYSQPTNVSSLRIFKNYQSSWTLVAQITDLEPNKVYVKDESIVSQTGDLTPSGNTVGRMSITWNPASSETLGQYKCHSSRYTANQNEIVTKYSTISLGSDLNALAILRVMKSDKEEIKEALSRLEEKTANYEEKLKTAADTELVKIQEEIASLEMELNVTLTEQDERLEQLRAQIEDLIEESQQDYLNRFDAIDSRLDEVLERGFHLLWPAGTYALPQPATGCPSSGGVSWKTGYRRHHTESTDRNKDQVSEGNHLQLPVLSRESSQNYVTQRFCVKTDSVSPGPVWPSGTYCISKHAACPSLFQEGSVKWNDQKREGLSTVNGVVPSGLYSGNNTTIYYCCRKDSPTNKTVDLPRSQPFYLYRYGGQCQQVSGMSVTEESIRFDTENESNGDETTDPHPDVELNNVVLHLCYYQQI